SREKARLKFLFLQHGWTAEKFLAAIEDRLGVALEHGAPDDPPEDVYRDHVGLHRQKQEGLVYAGVAILRGRLGPAEMRAAADLAERYGTGELRTTNMQNLLIPHVRRERAGALARELEAAGLRLEASPFPRRTSARRSSGCSARSSPSVFPGRPSGSSARATPTRSSARGSPAGWSRRRSATSRPASRPTAWTAEEHGLLPGLPRAGRPAR